MHWILTFGIAISLFISSIFGGFSVPVYNAQNSTATTTQQVTTNNTVTTHTTVHTGTGSTTQNVKGSADHCYQCSVTQTTTTTVSATVSAGAGDCVTPWGNVVVHNGGSIADVPYFSNGTEPPGSAFSEGSSRCDNGTWVFVARDRTHQSCSTPWQNTIVADGQVISAVPYFTNGNTSTSQEAYGTSYRCSNATWVFIPKPKS